MDSEQEKVIPIKKLQVDGKEYIGNVIPTEATKYKKTIQVNIFTEDKKEEEKSLSGED